MVLHVSASKARGAYCLSRSQSDVLSFLLSLANVTGIDLAGAFQAKMDATEAKYPAERVRGRYHRPQG